MVSESPRLNGPDEEHVRRLVESEGMFPPILVHRATMVVVDGVHRLRAAERRGEEVIAARFLDCSRGEIFVESVRANVAHGLPLSLADRKAAASRILISHPFWSDRTIAAVAGIAHKTVGRIRRGLSERVAETPVRIGMDGHVRPVAGHGRALAEELINRHPGISLRKVAAAAGISVSTAHDVRRRMNLVGHADPRAAEGVGPGGGSVVAIGGGRGDRDGGAGEGTPRLSVRGPESVSLAQVIERMRVDPSLRFTEAGRVLLRVLGTHSLAAREWNSLVDSVPVHWASTVADLARELAVGWEEFAAQLDKGAGR
nr:ParB N-terminal domain-containing protein [Actinophytocola xanthii]